MTTTEAPPVVWETPTMEVPREENRFNRPLVKHPETGKLTPYTRTTTYVKCLDDESALTRWKQRKVARGLSKRDDLLLAVASMGDQPEEDDADQVKTWKREMDKLCESAMEADGSSKAATTGTALHAIMETDDKGIDPGRLPGDYQRYLDAYRRATSHLEHVYIEQFMVRDDLKVGGTPDRIMKVPGNDQLVIGDIKTGVNLDFGQAAIAMQLAMYANSQLYDPATGKRTNLDINLDRGLIIALNSKTGICELMWIDIATGWEGVRLARNVRSWRSRRKFTTPYIGQGAGAQDLVAEAQAALVQAIVAAESPEALVRLWQRAGTAWAEEHTGLAAQRKAELLGMRS
jgi:hypothetical protein